MVTKLFSPGSWMEATGAELLGDPSALEAVDRVVTDSREAGEGSLFAALPGERTRGWDFLEQAASGGCRAYLGPRSAGGAFASAWRVRPNTAYLLADDPVGALHAAAGRYRELCPATIRIGVTGSHGKTGVKEMLKAVFSVAGETVATQGNRNSIISLPGEVLRIAPQTRFAILEMGIDHQGEMDVLVETFRPHAAIITAIGTAHAAQLGGRDGIAREKKRIALRMGQDGVLVLPRDDDYRGFLADGFPGTVLEFGEADAEAGSLRVAGWHRTSFRWKGLEVDLPVAGRHQVRNALAALVLAEYFGVPPREAVKALATLSLPGGRGRWLPGPVSVYDDSYNANPQSMWALLDLVAEVPRTGSLHLVLGAMKELGSLSAEAHAELGRRVAHLEAESLVFVGEEAHPAFEAAVTLGYPGKLVWLPEVSAAAEPLKGWVKEGDTVVLKGSRSVGLEVLISQVQEGMEGVV